MQLDNQANQQQSTHKDDESRVRRHVRQRHVRALLNIRFGLSPAAIQTLIRRGGSGMRSIRGGVLERLRWRTHGTVAAWHQRVDASVQAC